MEGLLSHQCRAQSLGKKKKKLQVDKGWGNPKESATVCTVYSHVQDRFKGVTIGASVTR